MTAELARGRPRALPIVERRVRVSSCAVTTRRARVGALLPGCETVALPTLTDGVEATPAPENPHMAPIAAADIFVHGPPADIDVHRSLTVLDPLVEGRDVAGLQRAVRDRLASLCNDAIPVPRDGRYTALTELACIHAQYLLGLRADSYLKRDRDGRRVLTPGAQRIIREPSTRVSDERLRAAFRRAQMARGPRYYAELAARLGLAGSGARDALSFAAAHIGARERPMGSNSGPLIDAWCRLAGYTSPVPWDGCFVNACLVAAGLPSGAGWSIGYVPAIVARAKSGARGWSWHATGQRGDLALFAAAAGDASAVHVELVRARLSNEHYSTYGGNTSSGRDGSQVDGGLVARRDDRCTVGDLHIVGFARPPYPR